MDEQILTLAAEQRPKQAKISLKLLPALLSLSKLEPAP